MKWEGWAFTSLIILVIVVCIIECHKPEGFDESEHMVYVDRVFMGEPNDYTFITAHEDKTTTVWRVSSYFAEFKMFYDVPKNERMYVKYKKEWKDGGPKYKYVHIHIHEMKDVEGGGWNHGKFGSGRTQAIE